MLTRAFVTAGVRDATAGIHNIRDRVRGATHLRRRRAENWDIMAVGVKGEDWVGCESELLKSPTARQWRGWLSSPCECLAFWFRCGPNFIDVFPAGSQVVEHLIFFSPEGTHAFMPAQSFLND